MAKELPQDCYISRPKKFGNGAKLKAYKTHINQDMIIMSKDKFKKVTKEMLDNYNKAMDKVTDAKIEKETEMLMKLAKN